MVRASLSEIVEPTRDELLGCSGRRGPSPEEDPRTSPPCVVEILALSMGAADDDDDDWF